MRLVPRLMTFAGSTYTVTVTVDKAGGRLDRVLAEALPEISRTRLKALIEDGQVEALAASWRIRRCASGKASFVVTVPATSPAAPRPQVMPLAIAHEDEHLIVIDKPAGLVVHAGAGNPDGTLVNALIAHCPEGLEHRRAPAGDRTSPRQGYRGLLVVAKTDAAHAALARQFAEHSSNEPTRL